MLPAPSAQLVGEDALEGPQLRQGCPGLLVQLGLGKLPGHPSAISFFWIHTIVHDFAI